MRWVGECIQDMKSADSIGGGELDMQILQIDHDIKPHACCCCGGVVLSS